MTVETPHCTVAVSTNPVAISNINIDSIGFG